MQSKNAVRKYVWAWIVSGTLVLAVASGAIGRGSDTSVSLPVPDSGPLVVYTPGASVPSTLPVLARTQLAPGPSDGPPAVVTSLGGELDLSDETPEVIDPLQTVDAWPIFSSPLSGTSYWSVVDASVMEFESSTRRGVSSLIASDVVRSVSASAAYYDGMLSGVGEAILDVEIRDADSIDTDGNGIPDATALLEPFTLMIDENGNVTFAVDLGTPDRGAPYDGFYAVAFDSSDGPIEISVSAPTLAQLAAVEASYSAYTAGRLVVTIAEDAADLVDIPADADPAAEFDLHDSVVPFPDPESFFIRTLMMVTDDTDLRTEGRGTVPQWTFIDILPGDLEIVIEVAGPGVANQLEVGDVGYGYTYIAFGSQEDENLLAGSVTNIWASTRNFEIENEQNGDDATNRDSDSVETGDDTLIFSGRVASGIFGSNLMPRLDSGGGGSSGCFIATAAYGTPMAAEIQSLRDVRDTYLMDTALGAAFVDVYYRVSPPIARIVSEYSFAKTGMRMVLTPVVAVSAWTMGAMHVAGMALVVAMFGLAATLRMNRRLQTRAGKQRG